MPTYEYACDACGHTFELFQSITARPIRRCPECGRLKAQRLIGVGAGVIFKGSGFYQTDYRSEAYRKAAKADSETGSETKKADKKKSEKKTSSSKGAAES